MCMYVGVVSKRDVGRCGALGWGARYVCVYPGEPVRTYTRVWVYIYGFFLWLFSYLCTGLKARISPRVRISMMWLEASLATSLLLVRGVSAHGGCLNYTVGETWYAG